MKKSLLLIVTLLITVIGSYAQDQKPVSTDTYTDAQGRVHVVRNFETIEENNYKKTCTTNVDKTESTSTSTSTSTNTGLSEADIIAIMDKYFAEKMKAPETTSNDAETIKLLQKSIKLQKVGLGFNIFFGLTNAALGSANLAYGVKNNKLLKGLQSTLANAGVKTSWTLPGVKSSDPTDFGTGSNDSNYSNTTNNTSQTNTTTATQWDLP